MSTDMTIAYAALNPTSAAAAARARREDPGVSEPALEAVAGVPAPMRIERARAITMAVEVDPVPPHRRWRFFIFFLLVRLAARVYPFKFELYRTRQPWE